jgi:hypothetical protein
MTFEYAGQREGCGTSHGRLRRNDAKVLHKFFGHATIRTS